MKVSVFGLGYVGAVTSACLARDGIEVVGVDINPDKVALINEGRAPIIELGLTELMQAGIASGKLRATTDSAQAVADTDVCLISVGTPSDQRGALDLGYVHKVCEEIGAAVKAKGSAQVVVIRSTVVPGTTRRCRAILREHAGDVPIHVAFNPEFLREGCAIRDYDAPPYTVIGTADPVAEQAVRDLYAGIDAPVLVVESEEAELVKATANAWHATKIVFANEIGRLAKAHHVDGRVVMDLMKQDTKLNISPAYLSPGFAYGGSCLPKDVRALTAIGEDTDVALPLLRALEASNVAHIDAAEKQALALGKKRIGLVGLAFKPGTDDLRESPGVMLAERLLAAGCELRILDDAVREATLMGANKRFIEERMPELPDLLVDTPEALLAFADAVVLTHGTARLRSIVTQAGADIPVLDLAGLFQQSPEGTSYAGSCW